MTSAQRRESIVSLLKDTTQPISAAALAKQLNVSRQAIVGDIALLRAAGMDILSTPRGYIVAPLMQNDGIVRTIACNHTPENMEKEIYTIIDNGGALIDVIVEHRIYGQLTGQLNIFSRYDADEFIKSTKEQNAPLLSKLTNGVHLHTIRCKNEETFQRIVSALENANILLDKN